MPVCDRNKRMKFPENVPSGLDRNPQGPARHISLTLVVITLNEERHIERCIRSVPFATEIIVVDSYSQDRTTEIAGQLGAHVMLREFKGYRDQKQFALERAT